MIASFKENTSLHKENNSKSIEIPDSLRYFLDAIRYPYLAL